MTELAVLTYNVRGLRDDYAALQRVIRGSGARLVFVQEAPKIFRARARAADLARRCGMVVVAGPVGAAGNLLMSDVGVRVHRAGEVLLPPTAGQQRRGATVADLSLAGRRFTVLGTHLSLDRDERARQARTLLELLGPGPAVLAGDLNEPPGGAVTATLSERLADAAGGDETPTFSTRRPSRRIDYVFADPALAVTRYGVLDGPDVRAASDHFPVRVTLDLGGISGGG
jgi:endonuclease/exonuclease/phosphatase family metal-dependent hydrolase